MRVSKDLYRNNQHQHKSQNQTLSEVNGDFLEFVQKNPDAQRAAQYKGLELNDELFTLQPWPTFVSQATRKEFEKASAKLFDLIKGLPKRVFGYDIKKISEYYGTPQSLVKLQLEGVTPEYLDYLVARGDFLLGSSGLKCLEYNFTTNLGGWYVPIWESLYLKNPVITKFLEEYRVNINNNNLIRQFIEHIGNSILEKAAEDEKQRNIVFVIREYKQFKDSIGTYIDKLYQMFLHRKNPLLTGQVFMVDYHLLEIVDNNVYYKGKKIHAVVEMYNGVVAPEIMEVFKAGNIRLMNGPICGILSSKLNLALLSDYKTLPTDIYSDEEKRVIDQYVPWSRKVVPGNTAYKGKKVELERFILSNKDQMVLKPSIGYGGKGVYIGQRIAENKWEELVETAIREGNWLVQEFIDASPGLYQVGEDGYDLHDIVWGFFVLGSQYAGAWARVLPQKDNKGVINCHQGATVSVIFDVES